MAFEILPDGSIPERTLVVQSLNLAVDWAGKQRLYDFR